MAIALRGVPPLAATWFTNMEAEFRNLIVKNVGNDIV